MLNTLIQQRLLPAVTFPSDHHVLPVTEALARGGINLLEVTLRTEAGIRAIRTIKKNIPGIMIGAGTILNLSQLHEAIDAGAIFGVSPSLNLSVVKEANRLKFPFIPGVMTPSEVETANENGCVLLKLFPASSIGGISFLKALQGPYAHLKLQFIPMGGVNPENMNDYLQIESVVAVGGSWLAPEGLINKSDFAAIEKNAREALSIGQKTNM